MYEQTPYVVDGRWIVYAKSTMEAAVRFQIECVSGGWPSVRLATPLDVARLPAIGSTGFRNAA